MLFRSEIEAKTNYYASLYTKEEPEEKGISEEELEYYKNKTSTIDEIAEQIKDLKAKLEETNKKEEVSQRRTPIIKVDKEVMEQLTKEVPMDKPNWEKEREFLTQRPVMKEQTQSTENSILKYKPGTIGYSEEVDNAIGEIDALLSEENN